MTDVAARPVADKHLLDLDAVFGVDKPPIIVRWQGKEYELTHPEAMNAEQLLKYEQLSAMAQDLSNKGARTGVKIERALQQLIEIIAPELAKRELTFLQKVTVMQFYNEQIEPAKGEAPAEEPDPTEPVEKPVKG